MPQNQVQRRRKRNGPPHSQNRTQNHVQNTFEAPNDAYGNVDHEFDKDGEFENEGGAAYNGTKYDDDGNTEGDVAYDKEYDDMAHDDVNYSYNNTEMEAHSDGSNQDDSWITEDDGSSQSHSCDISSQSDSRACAEVDFRTPFDERSDDLSMEFTDYSEDSS
jgi:hypothetical protein